MKPFLLFIILVNCITGCKSDKLLRTQIVNYDTTYFVGMWSKLNNPVLIMNEIEKDLNQVFSDTEIESSRYENEMRFFFSSNSNERYLVERYKDGKTTVSLYDLSYDKREDSLFINLNRSLEWEFSRSPKNYLKYRSQKIILDTALVQREATLHFGSEDFIQIKEGKNIQRIYAENPLEKSDTSNISNYVKSIIIKVQKQYQFLFAESFDDIIKRNVTIQPN